MSSPTLILVAAVLGYVYLKAYTYATYVAATQSTPAWWLSVLGNSGRSAVIWMMLLHVMTLALVSLPFAWILDRIYGRLALYLAFGFSVAICVFVKLQALSAHFAKASPLLQGLWLFDVLAVLVALPATVWAVRKWSSNYRIERSRER